MCNFIKSLWEKLLNMLRSSNENVVSYGHQGLTEVVHKWINSK